MLHVNVKCTFIQVNRMHSPNKCDRFSFVLSLSSPYTCRLPQVKKRIPLSDLHLKEEAFYISLPHEFSSVTHELPFAIKVACLCEKKFQVEQLF